MFFLRKIRFKTKKYIKNGKNGTFGWTPMALLMTWVPGGPKSMVLDWIYPPPTRIQDASHHENYCICCRESIYRASFATSTGWVVDPRYISEVQGLNTNQKKEPYYGGFQLSTSSWHVPGPQNHTKKTSDFTLISTTKGRQCKQTWVNLQILGSTF